jgi:hypothetical protein
MPKMDFLYNSFGEYFNTSQKTPAVISEATNRLTAEDLCTNTSLSGKEYNDIYRFPVKVQNQEVLLTENNFKSYVKLQLIYQDVIDALKINGSITPYYDLCVEEIEVKNLAEKNPSYTVYLDGKKITVYEYAPKKKNFKEFIIKQTHNYCNSNRFFGIISNFIPLYIDPVVLINRCFLFIAEKTKKPELTKLVYKISRSAVKAILGVAFAIASIKMAALQALIVSIGVVAIIGLVVYSKMNNTTEELTLDRKFKLLKEGLQILGAVSIFFVVTSTVTKVFALFYMLIIIPGNLYADVNKAVLEYKEV